jgi:phospholipase/carboxylesterase
MAVKYKNTEWRGKKIIIGETELDKEKPINLLIGFHGADSTPENMLIHGNRLQLKNTVLVYPEGPVDAGEGLWSWWEDGPRQKKAVAEFLKYAAQTVDEAQRHFSENLPGSSLRICLWGFSQGAAASLVYTLFGSHPLHRVASICGFLPELPDDTVLQRSVVDILGIFGANDEIVPSFLADYALDEMKTKGHQLTVKETPQGHEINQENLQDITDFFNS